MGPSWSELQVTALRISSLQHPMRYPHDNGTMRKPTWKGDVNRTRGSWTEVWEGVCMASQRQIYKTDCGKNNFTKPLCWDTTVCWKRRVEVVGVLPFTLPSHWNSCLDWRGKKELCQETYVLSAEYDTTWDSSHQSKIIKKPTAFLNIYLLQSLTQWLSCKVALWQRETETKALTTAAFPKASKTKQKYVISFSEVWCDLISCVASVVFFYLVSLWAYGIPPYYGQECLFWIILRT